MHSCYFVRACGRVMFKSIYGRSGSLKMDPRRGTRSFLNLFSSTRKRARPRVCRFHMNRLLMRWKTKTNVVDSHVPYRLLRCECEVEDKMGLVMHANTLIVVFCYYELLRNNFRPYIILCCRCVGLLLNGLI